MSPLQFSPPKLGPTSLVPSIQDTLVGGGGGGCGVKINLTPEVLELAQTHVARASHNFSR